MLLAWMLSFFAQDAGCQAALDQARIAYESRRFEMAVGLFRSASETCGSHTQVLLGLAQAQLMAQQFAGSLDTLTRLVRQDPRNVVALKLHGDALYLAGKVEEAVQSLQKAIAVDPQHEPTLYALGRIYYQENRFPESMEIFQKILSTDPKHYRAHNSLALCYSALQRDTEALRHFFKALELVHKDHPQYDAAHANLANFFLERNEYEKAFQLGAEAAQRNPASARNFFLTGKALSKLGKDELSLRWLEEAVKLDAGYQEAYYLLSRAYRKAGRIPEADGALAKFRELSKTPRDRR